MRWSQRGAAYGKNIARDPLLLAVQCATRRQLALNGPGRRWRDGGARRADTLPYPAGGYRARRPVPRAIPSGRAGTRPLYLCLASAN
jgi:hypothetical protein